MTLPAALARDIEEVLAGDGEPARIRSVQHVGGGCITPAARLDVAAAGGGERWFLKWSDSSSQAGLFRAEARSLEALHAARAVRVPNVRAVGDRWLLLEWLEPGASNSIGWSALGAGLAGLHGHTSDAFGSEDDNFIGTLPQANDRASRWPEFWRERRLRPQLERALRSGALNASDARRFDDLFDRLDVALAVGAAEGASLLHGDLWSGNVHFVADGSAALVDPSSYFGHREVDLAMAELFGGFALEFFAAYEGVWRVAEGYRELRRPIYQLYYLLVHVNLFGGGYVRGTREALDRALVAF